MTIVIMSETISSYKEHQKSRPIRYRHQPFTEEGNYIVENRFWKYVIPEVPTHRSISAFVDRRFLWGTQAPNEYCYSSRRKFEKDIKMAGPGIFEAFPALVIPIGSIDSMRLILIDRHHGIRYLPLYAKEESQWIPCLVISRYFLSEQLGEDHEQYSEKLMRASYYALTEFCKKYEWRGVEFPVPQHIKGDDARMIWDQLDRPYIAGSVK